MNSHQQDINNTIQYYDENAKNYSKMLKNKDVGFFLPDKAKIFMDLLPSGKVLEIGCGTGNEARLLIEHGYDYLGTDISEGMIREAEERNPSGKFKVLSANQVDTLNDKFDGFWANLSLVHITKNEIISVLKKIRSVLADDGVGYISLKEGELEGTDPKGRFFSHYSLEEFSDILIKSGFTIEDSEMIERNTRRFLSFIVRK
jgi:SAM-dependent methyltransferase